ncbi:unnamed protein product, partial [Ectocarpus sp. 13 AM-2016]
AGVVCVFCLLDCPCFVASRTSRRRRRRARVLFAAASMSSWTEVMILMAWSICTATLTHKRAWEVDVEADDKDEGDDTTPSEAFLSLQRELEEKEKIQQENAERAKNQDALAAEAAN